MKKWQELLINYDFKLGKAIQQNKLPMVAYYYARMTAILDLKGRTNENKSLIPNWQKWNSFSQTFKVEVKK